MSAMIICNLALCLLEATDIKTIIVFLIYLYYYGKYLKIPKELDEK